MGPLARILEARTNFGKSLLRRDEVGRSGGEVGETALPACLSNRIPFTLFGLDVPRCDSLLSNYVATRCARHGDNTVRISFYSDSHPNHYFVSKPWFHRTEDMYTIPVSDFAYFHCILPFGEAERLQSEARYT